MKAYLSGFRAWLVQRITAAYLLAFVLYFVIYLLFAQPVSFEAWRGWILSPGTRVATFLFFTAIALHAWVGLRDVIIDYVKPLPLRLSLFSAVAGGLLAILFWAGRILSA